MKKPHALLLPPLLLLQLALCSFLCSGGAPPQPPNTPKFACDVVANPGLAALGFCNTSWELPARARDLVQRLTLPEKIGFLGHVSRAVPRLGIPSYNWWSEALHGVSFIGGGSRFSSVVPGATSFPQVILTAASFNVTLFRTIGEVVSTEARAMHNVGLAGLSFWSPNINILRDPRWGRAQETPGEDPLLTSKYAEAFVSGLQHTEASGPQKLKVAACCKHYTAYDLDNWKGIQRYTFDAKVTKQDMEDTFQPPFKSCVTNGVACAMCSYNKVNGVPTCADPALLGGTVRGDWGLNGYIVSDCDSVDILYGAQHYAKTPEEAAAMTISAGLDLDCGTFLLNHTSKAIETGKLREAQVDKAVTNSFIVLMRLGFFDGDPRKIGPFGGLGPRDVCTPAHQELARDAARQGIVLLKNDNSALPLKPKDVKSMAVIGPNAAVTGTMIGNYGGIPCRYTTPLQGLSATVSTVYEPGCTDIFCTESSIRVGPAVAAAARADATVLIVGTNLSIEGEGLDRETLGWPGLQGKLIDAVAEAAKGPVILVIMSGGPIDVSREKLNRKIPSILWVGYPGEAGGAALADVIFGRYNPGGRTPFTWYAESYLNKVPMTDMRMRSDSRTGYPGRTYRFYRGNPIYAFGHGLSYTDFDYRLLSAPANLSIELPEGDPCRSGRGCRSVDVAALGASSRCSSLLFDVRVQVRNAGAVGGGHSVLLYAAPPRRAVRGAPRKQLVGFEKVTVAAGGAEEVVFEVDACRDLSVADEEGKRKLALGSYVLGFGHLRHPFTLGLF